LIARGRRIKSGTPWRGNAGISFLPGGDSPAAGGFPRAGAQFSEPKSSSLVRLDERLKIFF